jgi:hypothetical protein
MAAIPFENSFLKKGELSRQKRVPQHGSRLSDRQLSRLLRAPDTDAKKRAGRRLWSCSTINLFARHPNFDPMAGLLPVF